MEKTIKLCDSCGRSDNIEKYMIGSYDEFDGHRNEEEYVYVDLCCYCFDLLKKVKYLLNTSQAKMFNIEKEEVVKLLMFLIKEQRVQLR